MLRLLLLPCKGGEAETCIQDEVAKLKYQWIKFNLEKLEILKIKGKKLDIWKGEHVAN